MPVPRSGTERTSSTCHSRTTAGMSWWKSPVWHPQVGPIAVGLNEEKLLDIACVKGASSEAV